MAGRILGLFVSVFLILGGISGEMVLRGTDSSGGLILAGFGFLIYDIISIIKYLKAKKTIEKAINVGAQSPEDAHKKATEYMKDAKDTKDCCRAYIKIEVGHKIFFNNVDKSNSNLDGSAPIVATFYFDRAVIYSVIEDNKAVGYNTFEVNGQSEFYLKFVYAKGWSVVDKEEFEREDIVYSAFDY